MTACLLMFVLSYVRRKVKVWGYSIAGVLFGSLAFFSESIRRAELTKVSFYVDGLDLYYLSLLLFCGFCALYGTILLFLNYKHSVNRQQRQQALALSIAIGQATVIVLTFSVYTIGFLAQLMVLLSCFVAVSVMAYAIIHHGLFDIKFFVIRAAAYLTTLFVTTLVFIAPVVIFFVHLFGANIGWGEILLIIFGSTVAYHVIQFIRKYFDRITNSIFFRNYYDPQKVLDELTDVLVYTTEPTLLRDRSKDVISNAFKPEFVRYLLFESSDKKDAEIAKTIATYMKENLVITDNIVNNPNLVNVLKHENIALCVKLRTNEGDLGYLALGYRRSGEMYSSRDAHLLTVIADSLSIGLQNVFRFEEIQRFNITLQQRIDEATKKLRRMNERLRLLDQTKDDFISMASHQLRTPLTSVKGYVSMVLDGDAGPINATQRKLLTQAFLSSQRMVYLISDLLNVSRLKTGKFIIEPVESRLDKVVEEELEQLTETVKSRGLTLTYHKPEHFPTLMIDETKIRQVIMNFVDNAIYYTPSGGTIDVYLEDKGASIEFRVVDTGIGVPKHEQHHLFTKFYRASNAKNARPDGTGLGIFMAKKVVIAQGGAVIFKSAEGKGSTFGFTFPKAKLLPPLKPESKQPASKEAQPA